MLDVKRKHSKTSFFQHSNLEIIWVSCKVLELLNTKDIIKRDSKPPKCQGCYSGKFPHYTSYENEYPCIVGYRTCQYMLILTFGSLIRSKNCSTLRISLKGSQNHPNFQVVIQVSFLTIPRIRMDILSWYVGYRTCQYMLILVGQISLPYVCCFLVWMIS